MGESSELLGKGIFTVPEAARLLEVSDTRVRGWIQGYPSTEVGPLIDPEVEKRGRLTVLTFTNLMEARFVDAFVRLGMHVRSIRAVVGEARRIVQHAHPFATNTVFKTFDGKLFAEILKETGEKQLYDLAKKNWAIHDMLAPLLKGEVAYNEKGFAQEWQPRPNRAPNVIVDPRFAFGQPIVRDALVPTRTLLEAFIKEGDIRVDDAYANVAAWYRVPQEAVREAVDFEYSLYPLKHDA